MIPKVTIAIPTIGRYKYFEETLKSALKQTYTNIEIIISDNASIDETETKCLEYINDERILYYRQESRLEMVENWNFLLSKSSGEYFLLLSDDDLLEEDMISQLINGLIVNKDHNISMAYCPVKYIDYKGNGISNSISSPDFEDGFSFVKACFLYKRVLFPSAILFKTDVLNKINGFDDSSSFGTDMIARINVAMNHNVICINKPLVKYRRHNDSLSFSMESFNSHESLFSYFKSENFSYNILFKSDIDYYINRTRYILIRQMIFLGKFSYSDLLKSSYYKYGSKIGLLKLSIFLLIPFKSYIYGFRIFITKKFI